MAVLFGVLPYNWFTEVLCSGVIQFGIPLGRCFKIFVTVVAAWLASRNAKPALDGLAGFDAGEPGS